MKFLIATNNKKKLEELNRILNPLGIDCVTAKDLGVTLEDVEENGSTFAENALIKAVAGCERCGLPAIADDSGLCVDALNGAPGIYSARYGGEGATDKDKYMKLLGELESVEKEKRTAHFSCAVVCVFPDGTKIQAEGVCNGSIATEPDGDGGFGYDPVFLYNNTSFGKLSAEEKDAVSHRGNALRDFKMKLEKYLEENNVNK